MVGSAGVAVSREKLRGRNVSHCSAPPSASSLLCSWALTVSPHIKHSPLDGEGEGGVSSRVEEKISIAHVHVYHKALTNKNIPMCQ